MLCVSGAGGPTKGGGAIAQAPAQVAAAMKPSRMALQSHMDLKFADLAQVFKAS